MHFVDTAFLFAKNISFIVIGLIGMNFLVGFHELGHYLFCKLFNIKTPTFSIGFGSFIISKKIGDTNFGIARYPLGGYVEIAGLAEVGQGDQKDAQLSGDQSFASKPFWQKFLVMLGGIIFNLMFAYFAFALIFLTGMPKSPIAYPDNAIPVVESVSPDSPAYKAGLLAIDHIVRINNTPIDDVHTLIEAINSNAGQTIQVSVKRNKKQITIPVSVDTKTILGEKRGFIGVEFALNDLPPYSLSDSIKKSFHLVNKHICNTFRAFKHMFANKDTSNVGGPISIIRATTAGAQKGIKIFILLLALISINLAVLNTLPLPILDGGQILFAAIEAIIRRPLPEQIREYIHIGSWIGIMALFVYLSARDIYRIIEPLIQPYLPF